jgi:hypothetical protein
VWSRLRRRLGRGRLSNWVKCKYLGRFGLIDRTSIEINHKPFEIVKKSQIGGGAAIKIERAPHEAAKLYGRQ